MSFLRKFFTADRTATNSNTIPTVKFDRRLVTQEVRRDLWATIEGLDEIPGEFKKRAYEAALVMVLRGRDAGHLADVLRGFRLNNLTDREIGELSIYLANRSTALIDKERLLSNGIRQAMWIYSGAPCTGSDGLDELHRRANGSIFQVANGLLLDGRHSWPGLERGCKCTTKPMISGFT